MKFKIRNMKKLHTVIFLPPGAQESSYGLGGARNVFGGSFLVLLGTSFSSGDGLEAEYGR